MTKMMESEHGDSFFGARGASIVLRASVEKSVRSHVIVDLGEAQPSTQIRRLRKGKGKLFQHVETIIDDLIAAGTVKSNAQPVVIIVRELPSFWPFEDHED